MVNAISSTNYKNPTVPKTQIQAEQKPVLDKILKESSEIQEKSKQTSLFKKIMATPTLSVVPLLALFVGECGLALKLNNISKKLKKGLISKDVAQKFKDKVPQKFLLLAGLMIPIYFAMDFINNKTKDKHYANANKIVDNFNKETKANLDLVIQPINSQIIAALTDTISGKIVLGEQFCNDAIYANTHQKAMLNHELVHAKQYALMACSENGLEKLNYISMKKTAESFNEKGKEEVKNAYVEIQSGLGEKYQNATIDRFGYKMPLVNYITALYKIIYEPNTTEKDIPMVINKTYYQAIIDKKGKLSPEEETKAQAYLKAYEKYPIQISLGKVLNPKSDYKGNLLEQEAFKMNPWYTR